MPAAPPSPDTPDPVELARAWGRAYQERGWAVFPLAEDSSGRKVPHRNCPACRPGEPGWLDHPGGPGSCPCGQPLCHGFYAATTDPVRLDELLAAAGPGWRGALAIRTGAASELLVLDVEVEHPEVLDEFEALTGGLALPRTATARSVSGGWHLYLRLPPGAPAVASGRFARGADVKAEAGYVGAVAGTGGRAWLGTAGAVGEVPEPAEAPRELLDWLGARRRLGFGGRSGDVAGPGDGYDFERFRRDGCPDGYRDHFVNDLCFRLRRAGVTRERYEAALLDAWLRLEQPPRARWEMPWEDVAYKLERVWREVRPASEDVPAGWRGGPGGGAAAGGEEVGGDGEVRAAPPVAAVGAEPLPWAHGEPLSDTGNARRFVRLLGERVRYVPETRRWLVWDGTRWAPDQLNRALQWTFAVAADLRDEALTVPEEQRPRYVAWVRASESVRGRRALLEAAAVEHPVAVELAALDRDPELLAVRNGTLDLRTGKLRPSDPGDLITRRAAVAWDPAASCPRWREHVAFVAAGDPPLAAYLRRCAGYSLTGRVDQQAFFLLEGSGDNGKNAFVEPLLLLLGDYAQTGTSALLTGGDEQHPTILADLAGARLVFVDEPRQGQALNVERVKQLTGSRRIRARYMRGNLFEFDTQLKLWIAGNGHPAVRDASDGTWRRLHRVPFRAKVDPDRKIRDYGVLLHEEEGPGILNWALEGLRELRELGSLGQPVAVDEAVAELRADEDLVGLFLAERCEVTGDEADAVSVGELYSAYTIWAALAGLGGADRLDRRHFGRRVSGRPGIDRYLRKEGGTVRRGYLGVRLA